MDIDEDTIAELIAFANNNPDIEFPVPLPAVFSAEEFELAEAPLHTSQVLVGRNFDTDEELTLSRTDRWLSKLPRGLRPA